MLRFISKISQSITVNAAFYSVQFNLNLVHYPYTPANENILQVGESGSSENVARHLHAIL